MRRSALLLLIILSGLAAVGGFANASTAGEFVTGEDWTDRMSTREKHMSLVPPSILFEEYDVHLSLSLPQYVTLMDRAMRLNPQFADEEVSNIFASTIYLAEPRNRPALRTMEMNFLQGDYETPADTPTLTIKSLLRESAGLTETPTES